MMVLLQPAGSDGELVFCVDEASEGGGGCNWCWIMQIVVEVVWAEGWLALVLVFLAVGVVPSWGLPVLVN